MKETKRLLFISLLVALGIVLGTFESQIPLPIPVPGAKLGLSNMVVLVAIYTLGYREGFLIMIFKSIVLMLVTGAVSAFIFSANGALFSSIAMILSHKYLRKYLSPIGVSEIGSAFHNFGQIVAAIFILKSKTLISYLPYLLLMGIFTGYFVGLASYYISKNVLKHKEIKWRN